MQGSNPETPGCRDSPPGLPRLGGHSPGGVVTNLATAGNLITSAVIALGNTAEGAVGAWQVQRSANGTRVFERASTLFRFAILSALLSTALSASAGTVVIALTGNAEWQA